MVCGLVDIEYCKLILGLHEKEKGEELFFNSNINLGTGSQAFSAFTPDRPVPIKTGLAEPEFYNSWDKIEITGDRSVQALLDEIEAKYNVQVQTLYDPQVPLDKAPNGIYSRADRAKLDWEIILTEDGTLEFPDDEDFPWKSLLANAGRMLKMLGPESGQRKMFEGQVSQTMASLAKTKETFAAKLAGTVSEAHISTYRPLCEEDEKKLAYFDSIASVRPYVQLNAECTTAEGAEVSLPHIKLVK